MATSAPILLVTHVAGPPEKEDADTRAGWQWVQRCLRCDCRIDTGVWWTLGGVVYELADGRMTSELPGDTDRSDERACEPEG